MNKVFNEEELLYIINGLKDGLSDFNGISNIQAYYLGESLLVGIEINDEFEVIQEYSQRFANFELTKEYIVSSYLKFFKISNMSLKK